MKREGKDQRGRERERRRKKSKEARRVVTLPEAGLPMELLQRVHEKNDLKVKFNHVG